MKEEPKASLGLEISLMLLLASLAWCLLCIGDRIRVDGFPWGPKAEIKAKE